MIPAATRKETTVATEQSATVVIKFKKLRDLSQNQRTRSQYAEAPKADPKATAIKKPDSPRPGNRPSAFSRGTNNNGEKTVAKLKAATSATNKSDFPTDTAA